MSCGGDLNGSNSLISVTSYYDLLNLCPKNPLDLIASASLNGTVGTLTNSTNFNSETWNDVGGLVVVSTKPNITTLATDSGEKVADAAQWNFSHLTWNSDVALPIPLRRMLFLRAGTEWTNRIGFTFTPTISDVQLSFLGNAATRGDKQGTIPVISWSGGSWTSAVTLDLVLRQPGIARMGLWLKSSGTVYYYMFDMEWIVVP